MGVRGGGAARADPRHHVSIMQHGPTTTPSCLDELYRRCGYPLSGRGGVLGMGDACTKIGQLARKLIQDKTPRFRK